MRPYALINFEHVLDTVWSTTASWWSEAERRIYVAFRDMDDDAKLVYVRLYQRKGLCHPQHKAEGIVPRFQAALATLSVAGLVHFQPESRHYKDMVRHLPLAHLRKALALPGASRDDCASALGLPAVLESVNTAWVVLEGTELFDRLVCLYFGSLSRDVSEFAKVALGYLKYPRYSVGDASAFASREHLELYLKWRLMNTHDVEIESAYRDASIPGRHVIWIARKLMDLAKSLERNGQEDEAITICRRFVEITCHPEALERLAILEIKRRRFRELFDVMRSCRSDHWSLKDRLRMGLRQFQVEKRLGLNPNPHAVMRKAPVKKCWADRLESRLGTKALYAHQGQAVTVEQLIQHRYLERGYGGVFAENSYIHTLVGLVAWDVVYCASEGAFFHPFQLGPQDLGEPGFCRRRAVTWQRWKHSFLKATPEIRWQAFCRQWQHTCALDHLFRPRPDLTCNDFKIWFGSHSHRLADLVEMFLEEYDSLRAGFPDLVIRQDVPVMVEVKGPGDQIRPGQRLWHHVLLELGYRVIVYEVRARS
ncbi:MAG: VRR-NUC domain-containing protein [Acidobacteria bacterium]|nr:VRR-NUC domain-containing protein [Acidobacteriota bacterium]